MVSSRASFEIVQKALFARTPLVFAVSTASTLSVDLAEEGNPTLIGFMKGERIAIYIHPIGLMFQKTSDSGWVLQNVLSFSYDGVSICYTV